MCARFQKFKEYVKVDKILFGLNMSLVSLYLFRKYVDYVYEHVFL